jgi:tRNA threonylcarbamoyl adenosine modification protein YjeE
VNAPILRVAVTLDETRAIAAKLAEALRALIAAEDGPKNVFVGLDGELGAGKTAFVQAFVGHLSEDQEEEVTSPTFALVQRYATEPPVTHMDLYRLGGLDDLEAIGYREHYFAPGVTLVEWSARAEAAYPRERIEVDLVVLPAGVREIRISTYGARLRDLVERTFGD